MDGSHINFQKLGALIKGTKFVLTINLAKMSGLYRSLASLILSSVSAWIRVLACTALRMMQRYPGFYLGGKLSTSCIHNLCHMFSREVQPLGGGGGV